MAGLEQGLETEGRDTDMARNKERKDGQASCNRSRRSLLVGGALAAVGLAGGAYAVKTLVSTSSMRVESFHVKGDGRTKKALVLTGSGRNGGNSDLLAEAFVKGAKSAGHEVDVFACGQKPMAACLHCGGCWSTGRPCVVEDSFEELWPLLEKAELLVLVSPLYWYNVSGHLKCAIDRFYPYSMKDRPRDMAVREAMLLMCGESLLPRSFAGPAEAYRQMLGYKRWKVRGRLFVGGVDAFGAMKGNAALETAEEMGRNA